MVTIILFLGIFIVKMKIVHAENIHSISFPSPHVYYEDLDSLAEEKIEICKSLSGEDRSEFIENHLDDYYFAMNIVSNTKVLRHYRELFTKLVKDFGH